MSVCVLKEKVCACVYFIVVSRREEDAGRREVGEEEDADDGFDRGDAWESGGEGDGDGTREDARARGGGGARTTTRREDDDARASRRGR